MMTSSQVVETSVNLFTDVPSQDFTHLDDYTSPTYNMTPGFKPTTVIMHQLFKKCTEVT